MSGVNNEASILIGGKHKGYNHEKANMVVSRPPLLRAKRVVVYHTLNVRSQQQGINFDWLSFEQSRGQSRLESHEES